MTTNSSDLPDKNILEAASKLNVLDGRGEKVSFGSIIGGQKTIVVFIRHFFCGSCQAYVAHLASLPNDALQDANVKIVVIGCGEWNPIVSYAETTGFHGPIYADPSRELYRTLGMNIETLAVTPAGQQRRSYLTSSLFVTTIQSIWKALKRPSLIGKQGNISQLGGEFIFGPGAVCSLASRMQHTEDHMEIAELLEAAGVSLS